MEDVFSIIAMFFETLGTLAMVGGIFIAGWLSVRALTRGESGAQAFTTLRETMGSAILLGLEILVAADLVRTITSNPSLQDALILGLIVIIRTILSMSIQIEIEGVLPWKKALLKSGGHLLAEVVSDEQQTHKAYKASQKQGSAAAGTSSGSSGSGGPAETSVSAGN